MVILHYQLHIKNGNKGIIVYFSEHGSNKLFNLKKESNSTNQTILNLVLI